VGHLHNMSLKRSVTGGLWGKGPLLPKGHQKIVKLEKKKGVGGGVKRAVSHRKDGDYRFQFEKGEVKEEGGSLWG